jgi:hypothetical protein
MKIDCPKIRIKNTSSTDFHPTVDEKNIYLKSNSIDEIDIDKWMIIKEKHLNGNNIFAENGLEEEKRAIESFKSKCFSEFEQLGISAVKTAVALNKITQSKVLEFATEWITSKAESKENEALAIAKQANLIAEEAKSIANESKEIFAKQAKLAMWAIIISIVSLMIAAIALNK